MRQSGMVTDREVDAELSLRASHHREERKTRHLLLRVDEKAADWEAEDAKNRLVELVAELKDEALFIAAAKSNSEDGSAGAGGDLGWIRRGQMVPAFESAAFKALKGKAIGSHTKPFWLASDLGRRHSHAPSEPRATPIGE